MNSSAAVIGHASATLHTDGGIVNSFNHFAMATYRYQVLTTPSIMPGSNDPMRDWIKSLVRRMLASFTVTR